jgi:CheY-like chemotaxis protein
MTIVSDTTPSKQPTSTLLLVEDEVLIRMAISQYLRECGYRVIEAANADEALKVLQSENSIDLVLSDVEMPGSLDGFGLAQWIRKNKEGLEIILAGSPERAAKTAGELCENGPTLNKPYEPQILLEAIRKQLGLRTNRRAAL